MLEHCCDGVEENYFTSISDRCWLVLCTLTGSVIITIVKGGTLSVGVGGAMVAAARVATVAIAVANITVAIIDNVGDADNITTFGVGNWIGFHFSL